VQALVEQQVGIFRDVLPGREFPRLFVDTQARIVLCGFLRTVEIVALHPTAGLAIGLEQLFQLVEVVRFGAEVAEMIVPLALGGLHRFAELGPVQAVEAVALDNRRIDPVT